jgi:uncharacterized membrane protein YfcA
MYWFIQILFLLLCGVVTYFTSKYNKKEQDLRKKYNVNYTIDEVIFEGKNLVLLVAIGFGGGFAAGAFGLGGGSIYNPALLALGVQPRVASATGMYLVLFSCINACVVNGLQGILNFRYGMFIGMFCSIGSLLGLILTDNYVKKSGKQSVFVWLLVLVFIIAAVATPFVGYYQLSADAADGFDIMGFQRICTK